MAELPQEPKMLSPEEEIRALEQKLEEKKRALEAGGAASRPEKEVFGEVLKRHIEDLKPSFELPERQIAAVPPALEAAIPPAFQKTGEVRNEERKTQLQKLIALALTKTIEAAVASAQKSTPYLLDELHDHLVDEYYDKLVALRKLKQL